MKNLFKKSLFIFGLTTSILLFPCWPRAFSIIKTEEIEVNYLFSLNNLSPEIISTAILYGNSLCQDRDENFYFLETANHRIIKTDFLGNIISQFGQIGQDEINLYYPFGFNLVGEYLYILNNMGREIKIFSLDGKYIKSFRIADVFQAESIVTDSKLIFADFRYKNRSAYGNYHLISVLSMNGRLIDKFGHLIDSNNFTGYINFNLVYLSLMEDLLFGAFKFLPIIFCYQTNGNKIFYKNLQDGNIEEIRAKVFRAKRDNLDLPPKTKSNQYFHGMRYCDGLTISKNKELYYAINSYKNEGFLFNKSTILILDKMGNLMRKKILQLNKENILVHSIGFSPKGYIYGIGSKDRDYFIFKF